MKRETKMLSLPEISEKYGIPVITLRKAAAAEPQKLKAVKISKNAWAATPEAVNEYLQQRQPTKRGRPRKSV